MNKKLILPWFLWIIIFSLFFGYSLVFAWPQMSDIKTSLIFKLSDNIYTWNIGLKSTKILFKSSKNLENYEIKSTCNTFSKLIYNNWDYYMFALKVFDDDCSEKFDFIDDLWEKQLGFELNVVSEYDMLSKLIDLETIRLVRMKNSLEKKLSILKKYEEYDEKISENYYNFLEKNRELEETMFNLDIINNIIDARGDKYIVPVAGHIMPTTQVKVPNSSRWYRDDYTDWIHHGWDIDWSFWEQVIALADWIIVRTVTGFEFSDLEKIEKWDNLSEETQLRNLDILRWNQVWLKTMSWDVIMYSHLNEIFSNIKSWEIVKQWQPLWAIWITWVPDKNYTDYHLHFVVHKNPYTEEKIWNYDYDDYMRWDWAFKGETSSYIIENQSKVFK